MGVREFVVLGNGRGRMARTMERGLKTPQELNAPTVSERTPTHWQDGYSTTPACTLAKGRHGDGWKFKFKFKFKDQATKWFAPWCRVFFWRVLGRTTLVKRTD